MTMTIFNLIGAQEQIDFINNLAVMLRSGIPINTSITTLTQQVKSKFFKKILADINRELEMGVSLSESFAKYEKQFGKIFISLIKTGEASGTLEKTLVFLAEWLDRNNNLSKEIKAATFYPKLVFGATFSMGLGLSFFILPKLMPVFTSMHIDLPIATRLLMNFTLFLQHYWYFGILIAIAFYTGLKLLVKVKAVRRILDKIFLNLYFVGGLIQDYQLALISHLMHTLYKSGVAIESAIDIIAESSSNTAYHDALRIIRDRTSKGVALSESIRQFPKLFPPNFITIIAVGEKSGTLEASFAQMGDFFLKEVYNKTKRLPTIVEPILLVIMGLVVVFIALAVIMPIYSITANVGG